MNNTIGQFFGLVVLPISMILYILLHFRNDKNLYAYAITMVFLFLAASVWLVIASGLFLIGLNMVSTWAKENKDI